MVPDFYAHADPPPLPDGHTVHRAPGPPLPRRQLLPGYVAAGIVLVLMVAGISGWLAL